MGRTSIPWLHTPITTAQLAPNDVTSVRWQRLYPGYFGFIFVQWKNVETCHPSLYAVCGRLSERHKKLCRFFQWKSRSLSLNSFVTQFYHCCFWIRDACMYRWAENKKYFTKYEPNMNENIKVPIIKTKLSCSLQLFLLQDVGRASKPVTVASFSKLVHVV